MIALKLNACFIALIWEYTLRIVLSVIFLLLSVLSCSALQYENKQLERQIESLFSPSLDLLDVKLALDSFAGGTPDYTKSEIEQMIAALQIMSANALTSGDKLTVLKRFLFEPGQWNGGRTFTYDMSDPLGKKPTNRILGHYIETRLGNCVTMPVLFLILGRSIGLDLSLSTAPLHVLVKYTDDSGQVWNLEPTSGGGFTRDDWYRKQLPMRDDAVANGVYLRTLNHEESVAVLANTSISHFLASNRPEDAIIASNVLLKHHPRDAPMMVQRASAFYLILKRDILDRYTHESQLTPDVKAYAVMLNAENLAGFAAAEALGWRETDGITSTSKETTPQ